jgi:hypothetical protein
VSLRICLVTPHAWSVPHDTNEHVAGIADALRARGHVVVVLAPSSRSADLLAGRRTLQTGVLDGVVAVSRAVPVSPRSAVGIPVGVRANVATALRRGDFDVVHGFDPGVPGLAYVALLEAQTTTAATFVDPERLGFPARRNLRDRMLARIDRLVATSDEVAERAATRFPAPVVVPPGRPRATAPAPGTTGRSRPRRGLASYAPRSARFAASAIGRRSCCGRHGSQHVRRSRSGSATASTSAPP